MRHGPRSPRITALAAALLALLHPAVSRACPACFSVLDERVLAAYWLSVAILSLLPLVIVGAFAAWLHRRFKTVSAADGAPSDAHSFHA